MAVAAVNLALDVTSAFLFLDAKCAFPRSGWVGEVMGCRAGSPSLLRFEIHFLKHTLSHSNFTSEQFWRGISSPWERAGGFCLHREGGRACRR